MACVRFCWLLIMLGDGQWTQEGAASLRAVLPESFTSYYSLFTSSFWGCCLAANSECLSSYPIVLAHGFGPCCILELQKTVWPPAVLWPRSIPLTAPRQRLIDDYSPSPFLTFTFKGTQNLSHAALQAELRISTATQLPDVTTCASQWLGNVDTWFDSSKFDCELFY
jgi:hypothetical protein